jgi:hypothetical protein
MRIRWRLALPTVGLMLFAVVGYGSFHTQRTRHPGPKRYFWWSSIRLDTDPLNRRFKPETPCQEEGCIDLGDPIYLTVHPGWPSKLLMLSAFPAFFAGIGLERILGRMGISEVTSFMVSMPLLLFAWYYFLGWLIDRRKSKRSKQPV